jgi:hypothetical protein
MEMSGEHHNPDALPPTSTKQDIGWAPELVWMLWGTVRSIQMKIARCSSLTKENNTHKFF